MIPQFMLFFVLRHRPRDRVPDRDPVLTVGQELAVLRTTRDMHERAVALHEEIVGDDPQPRSSGNGARPPNRCRRAGPPR